MDYPPPPDLWNVRIPTAGLDFVFFSLRHAKGKAAASIRALFGDHPHSQESFALWERPTTIKHLTAAR